MLENSEDDEDLSKEYGDQTCFALMLLAKIAAKTERKAKAIEAWKKALKMNPFLWNCFEELCKIGDKPDPKAFFQISNVENMSMCHGNSINNIDSVLITSNNSSLNMDTQDNFLHNTPQQILSALNSSKSLNSSDIKQLCSPDESPLAQPLSLSGFLPLSHAKHKPLRSRLDSASSVSNDIIFLSFVIIIIFY